MRGRQPLGSKDWCDPCSDFALIQALERRITDARDSIRGDINQHNEAVMNIALKLTTALCFAATLAGCARAGDATLDTTAADTAAAGAETTVSPSTVGPGVQTTPGTATGEPDQIHIVLREWSVRVSKSPIRAGRTTFHAMNEGKYQHAFEIEGNGQGWTVEPIKPAGTATLVADLRPGTYKVYCPIVDNHGNHQGRGMTTTLVVQ